jgi:RNA polymerase sigma factor (sigma-70 family)
MTESKNTEEQLYNRLLKKDRLSWKELYSNYSRYLTAVCTRYITDREDVKDTLQNSFIKMFNGIEHFDFRGEGALKAWATRIVVNESLKLLRDKKKFDKIFTDFETIEIAEDEPELENISAQKIHDMICELPVGYRTVFNLFVFEQKTHKEISQIMKISENTSASQFHRAKNILAKRIREYKSLKANAV